LSIFFKFWIKFHEKSFHEKNYSEVRDDDGELSSLGCKVTIVLTPCALGGFE